MNMRTDFLSRYWRLAVAVVFIALLSYVLFFHNLSSLLPGYSAREVATYKASSSLQGILDHPFNAPYKLLVLGLQQAGLDNWVVTRYVAAGFAVIMSLLFFVILRFWFSYRIAIIGTIMFATSSGFLHFARLGSSLILQMSILALVACVIWWRTYRTKRTLVGFASIAIFALLWYIPGMIWFELLLLGLKYKTLLHVWRESTVLQRVLGAVLFLVITAPLLKHLAFTPQSLLTFAGLPTHFVNLTQTGQNILDALLLVGVHSNGQAELWLAHAPLLNVTELALLVLGVYAFIRRVSAARRTFVFASVGISLLLIGLNGAGSAATLYGNQFAATGPMNASVLVPLLYLLLAGGMYELIQQWFQVFPRNPIARIGGIACLTLLIGFSVLYHYRAYFVAWPNNPATTKTFSLQQPQ